MDHRDPERRRSSRSASPNAQGSRNLPTRRQVPDRRNQPARARSSSARSDSGSYNRRGVERARASHTNSQGHPSSNFDYARRKHAQSSTGTRSNERRSRDASHGGTPHEHAASKIQPSLWTKQDEGQSRGRLAHAGSDGSGSSARSLIVSIALTILSALGKFVRIVGSAWWHLVRSSRIAAVASAIIVVLVVGSVYDGVTTSGRAFAGVHIGSIDVSGMTESEMHDAIQQTYADTIANASITVFASDEAASKTAEAAEAQNAQNAALAEQLAVDEAKASKEAWQATSESLGASLDADSAVSRALSIGRDDGGLAARIHSRIFGDHIDLHATLDSEKVDELAGEIDSAIGVVRNDWGISVAQGQAWASEGNDGWMIDRSSFAEQIAAAFLTDSDTDASIVAHTEYAPMRIDEEAARKAAEHVNSVLANGCKIDYEGSSWKPNATQIGSWVCQWVEPSGDGWSLHVGINASAANPIIVQQLQDASGSEPAKISFDVTDDDVIVNTDGKSIMPDVSSLADDLSNTLFGSGDAVSGEGFATSEQAISAHATEVSSQLTFDQALELGIIGEMGTYTTEYTTGSGTENRNHNIELVSQLLNNSVVSSGNIWSYNDTTGNCDESKGFLGAGAIIAGEYTDSVGGGICQVATTVFNAVYESGMTVTERHNHSLYIASYPQGRDAAVSYGELDLRWQNDTESDILVRVSTSNGSVTATLYGVDPGYQVTTETGQWEKGEEYSTTTKVDDTLAPGTRYVKTQGTNGSSIEVVRTVMDSDGNIVRQDLFDSVYDPNNEVVVTGPSSNAG